MECLGRQSRRDLRAAGIALLVFIEFSANADTPVGDFQAAQLRCISVLERPVSNAQRARLMPYAPAGVFSLRLKDGSYLNYIDMSLPAVSQNMVQAVDSYEALQAETYANRLPKFLNEQEVKPAEEARKTRALSVFILNTSKKIDSQPPEFYGGIRVAFSLNGEPLPFEQDLNFRRLKGSPPAAEVGRLVRGTSVAQGLTEAERAVDLIRSALIAIDFNPKVEVIYVHTSSVHVRLYERMGLKPKEVHSFDRLNQLMVFSRDQVTQFLQPGQLRNAYGT